MSKIKDSIIDVKVDDSDYDFVSSEYQKKLNEDSCEVERERDDYQSNLE